jgi:hypothetical protein
MNLTKNKLISKMQNDLLQTQLSIQCNSPEKVREEKIALISKNIFKKKN